MNNSILSYLHSISWHNTCSTVCPIMLGISPDSFQVIGDVPGLNQKMFIPSSIEWFRIIVQKYIFPERIIQFIFMNPAHDLRFVETLKSKWLINGCPVQKSDHMHSRLCIPSIYTSTPCRGVNKTFRKGRGYERGIWQGVMRGRINVSNWYFFYVGYTKIHLEIDIDICGPCPQPLNTVCTPDLAK